MRKVIATLGSFVCFYQRRMMSSVPQAGHVQVCVYSLHLNCGTGTRPPELSSDSSTFLSCSPFSSFLVLFFSIIGSFVLEVLVHPLLNIVLGISILSGLQ